MTTSRSKTSEYSSLSFRVGVFASTLILYLVTSYPTIAYIDSGELAIVNWTLGIAHPTGYPLYTILGRLFALLPLELIKTQILFGALCTSLAATILFSIASRVLRSESLIQNAIAGLTSVLFAICPLIWSQGVTNEVYSLHLLLVMTVVALLLSPFSAHQLLLGAFITGIAFGNHMSTVLLTPAIAYYLFTNRRKILSAPRLLPLTVLAIAIASSIYLYLPIRSSLDPMFNWGQPTNWANFVRHVTGWQYQVWMFSRPFDQVLKSLGSFTNILFSQFPIPYWLIVAYGLFTAIRKHRQIATILITILVFNILYALNFEIPDIDNYLLPSLVVLFIMSLYGIDAISRRLRKAPSYLTLSLVILIAWGLVSNWQSQDESRNTAALDGVHNYYASADSGSLVFCADWDFVSPWFYSHFYLTERQDMLLIDNELARRSWYGDWIRHADSNLHAFIVPEINAFLPHVRKFEAGESYDPREIEQSYRNLLMKMMRYPNKKFYFDQSVELAFPPPGQTHISGQLVRVIREGEVWNGFSREIPAPRFGKPPEYLKPREELRLRNYQRMVDLAREAEN